MAVVGSYRVKIFFTHDDWVALEAFFQRTVILFQADEEALVRETFPGTAFEDAAVLLLEQKVSTHSINARIRT